MLDTGDGEKLERWKDVVLCRPDPQVIWPKANPALWETADARYIRSSSGRRGMEVFSETAGALGAANSAL